MGHIFPKPIHHLVKGENYRVSFQETGNVEDSVWSCGPVVELIDDIPTCQVLIDRIVNDAEKIIADLPTRVSA